jgi:hypothetical protein
MPFNDHPPGRIGCPGMGEAIMEQNRRRYYFEASKATLEHSAASNNRPPLLKN